MEKNFKYSNAFKPTAEAYELKNSHMHMHTLNYMKRKAEQRYEIYC